MTKSFEESSREYMEELIKDPVRLKIFLRKVMGPPRRSLEGKEREHIWTLLQLIEPTSQSNNQMSWTDVYHLNGKEYQVHYFNEEVEIEEVDIE